MIYLSGVKHVWFCSIFFNLVISTKSERDINLFHLFMHSLVDSFFIYLFLEKGEGKERKRERNITISWCFPNACTWRLGQESDQQSFRFHADAQPAGPVVDSSICLDWTSNPQTLAYWNNALMDWATWTGQRVWFLRCLSHLG